ncbi:MAG: phosphoribosyltransferase [Caulobacteraceae bacterium]|nr:phosphoribosyltransferase [Caulobacter sp.]
MVEVLLDEAEVARRVEDLAGALADWIDDETVVVCLLTGGIWFAADLTRALARRGRNPLFDCLWLASYGDAETTSGRVVERAGLQRSVAGRRVLVVDEVIDSGLSLLAARRICERAGASEVRIAVFAEKPWPQARDIAPDHVAWRAPARYLVGYGMDSAGRMRGLPGVTALD